MNAGTFFFEELAERLGYRAWLQARYADELADAARAMSRWNPFRYFDAARARVNRWSASGQSRVATGSRALSRTLAITGALLDFGFAAHDEWQEESGLATERRVGRATTAGLAHAGLSAAGATGGAWAGAVIGGGVCGFFTVGAAAPACAWAGGTIGSGIGGYAVPRVVEWADQGTQYLERGTDWLGDNVVAPVVSGAGGLLESGRELVSGFF